MELSSATIKNSIINFLHRFHVIIFALVVLGGLVIVVLLLNDIIAKSGNNNDYTSPTANTTFDQATIDRLNKLKTRDEAPTPLDLSKGRTNPFIE